MRVIRLGKLPVEKKAQWTCTGCSAVIEARFGEGKITFDRRDGDYVTFQCPQCQESNHVDVSLFK